MADADDPFEFLARKREEMAVLQGAAALAQEQTLALRRLQERMAEVDTLAAGPETYAGVAESSLTPEERRRFGLDADFHTPGASQRSKAAVLNDLGDARNRGASPRFAVPRSPDRGGGDGVTPRSFHERLAGMDAFAARRDLDVGVVGPSFAVDERRRFGLDGGGHALVAAEHSRMPNMNGVGRPDRVFDSRKPAASPRFARPKSPDRGGGGTLTLRSPGRIGGDTPSWSSLSAEDRRRFGLDHTSATGSPWDSSNAGGGLGPEGYGEPRRPWPSSQGVAQPGVDFQHHGDVLRQRGVGQPLSMAQTLAQLEAVGESRVAKALRESELQLERLKSRG
eukprot:CAMPEP_0117493774 /NCGR_PEP_ID=MMETSP0784-20121206/19269_1 /TAXON_ID=39447 /ORGANISM="" /LENGTH=336 /DNA_ID=CAMNT_0005288633 /DNA_START=66 /DNA_END=1076 /DNA_ORIENTATION=+